MVPLVCLTTYGYGDIQPNKMMQPTDRVCMHSACATIKVCVGSIGGGDRGPTVPPPLQVVDMMASFKTFVRQLSSFGTLHV